MKNLLKLLLVAIMVNFSAQAVFAATTENIEAKALKVTGSVQVQLTAGSEAVPLTEGMSLPAGATIITGPGSLVELRTLAGGQTSVQANTTASLDELSVDRDNLGVITKQTATLSLRSGNLISTLDPKRKSINNYSVRTPKGVAAARGTVYAVTVSQSGTTVATMSGTVTLTPDDGGAPIVIDIATGVVIGQTDTSGNPVTLASLVQKEAADGTASGEGSITNAISQAVASVSAAVRNDEINPAATTTDGSNTTATSMLAAVVKVAARANPTQATNYTNTAITAASRSGGESAASMAAIAEAAAEGAVQGTLEANANTPDGGAAAAKAVVDAIATSANDAVEELWGQQFSNSLAQAAANGAKTGTTNANTTTGNNVTAPTVSVFSGFGQDASGLIIEETEELGADGDSEVITPLDPTVVSPSG